MATPDAVIEIGSTGVRLLVAEFTADKKRNVLDRAEIPLALGRDVFTEGTISRETQSVLLNILLRCKEHLSSWGIVPEQTSVIATSAFREANNRDPVMDKIYISTGFRINVIDGIEENRLMYLAVLDTLKEEDASLRAEDTVILEVGGGSTEMMLMKKGKMAGAHSFRLGTVRLESKMRAHAESLSDVKRYIEEFTTDTKGSLESELNISQVKQFIAVGSDATLVAIHIGRPISTFLWEIGRIEFENFVNEVQEYSIDECVARFKLSYNDAQTLHVSLLIYKMFIQFTNVQTIIVPETSIRDGLIISKTEEQGKGLHEEFHQQTIASAFSLLRKYHGDEIHAKRVREYCIKFYNFLEDELSLDNRALLLLEVSAILHDIGIFILMDEHNLHSEYIIRHSEIFGVTHAENIILSTMVRYHRGKRQPQESEHFQILARSDRMMILKLTAILRIADALDRSHGKSFSDFTLKKENDALVVRTKGSKNVALERFALAEKGDLFESVFGYKLVLL